MKQRIIDLIMIARGMEAFQEELAEKYVNDYSEFVRSLEQLALDMLGVPPHKCDDGLQGFSREWIENNLWDLPSKPSRLAVEQFVDRTIKDLELMKKDHPEFFNVGH